MDAEELRQATAVTQGRFEVLDFLGAGTMGRVYLAEQVGLDRRVVLKVLSSGLPQDDESGRRERFEREMRVLSRLEHPNIVRLYDYGQTPQGAPYLVMEYIDGVSLARLIREQAPVAPARVVRMGVQVARALVASHEEGIIHRDLKPDNIMVRDRYGERDVVTVLDFGIATGAPGGTMDRLTRDGAVLGTPAYMAPEQALGGPITPATDLYGLGCVLYHLATGHFPFVADTSMGVLYRHVHDPVVPPARVEGCDVPGWLSAVIVQLMAKDPDDRPPSASAVIELLETPPAVARASVVTADLGPTGETRGASRDATWGEPPVAPRSPAPATPPGGLGDGDLAAPEGPVESFELDIDPPMPASGGGAGDLPFGGAHGGAPYGAAESLPGTRPPRPPSPLITRPARDLRGAPPAGRPGARARTGRHPARLGGRGGLVAALVAVAVGAVALWWFGRTPATGDLEADAAAPLGDTLYEQRCEAGNLAACLDAAVRFRHGDGVPQDLARSNRLYARVVVGYRRGCDQGSGAFCHELAELYRAGTYVPMDAHRADELEQQACALGYAPSCSP